MTRPTRHYATEDQAAEQAAALAHTLATTAEKVGTPLLSCILATVRDPRASSDHLLLTADALREAADADPWMARGAYLALIATHLAHLAPTRATPLEAA